MPAGYSGTRLISKLGIRPGMKISLVNPPSDYYSLIKTDISDLLVKKKEMPDLVHLFVKTNKEFETEMKKLDPVYKKKPSLTIWVSWYKRSSKIPTDITEDVIRNYALRYGLLDVKVCAVSDVWSGLKLVVPLVNR